MHGHELTRISHQNEQANILLNSKTFYFVHFWARKNQQNDKMPSFLFFGIKYAGLVETFDIFHNFYKL